MSELSVLSLSRNSLPTLRVGIRINPCHNSASHHGLAQPSRCLSTQRIGIYIGLLTLQPGYKCHMYYNWWMYQSFIINKSFDTVRQHQTQRKTHCWLSFFIITSTTPLNKCFHRTCDKWMSRASVTWQDICHTHYSMYTCLSNTCIIPES